MVYCFCWSLETFSPSGEHTCRCWLQERVVLDMPLQELRQWMTDPDSLPQARQVGKWGCVNVALALGLYVPRA